MRRILAAATAAVAFTPAAEIEFADARPIPPLARCIIRAESSGDPQARNGIHLGLGQWDPPTWRRHRGTRYASTPLGATYSEQVQVIIRALQREGCIAWCPFDSC